MVRTLALLAVVGALACGGGSSPPPPPPPEANGVANAGPGQEVAVGGTATLDGSASRDPEGAALTYAWTQVHGPDVTAGAGGFSTAKPTFTLPSSVCTLIFELRVDDGNGSSPPSRVQIDVLEDVAAALFVDGTAGSDQTGDGTRAAPYASISHALEVSARSTVPLDVYVMAKAGEAAYLEPATLDVPPGTSLFGGYGAGWIRDTATSRTRLDGARVALRYLDVAYPAVVSGFRITAAPSLTAEAMVAGILVTGGDAELAIEDDIILAGDVGPGVAALPASSYGVAVVGVPSATGEAPPVRARVAIRGSRIEAGAGGDGAPGGDGALAIPGASGPNGSGGGGGSTPINAGAGWAGGSGGNGGPGDYRDGAWGSAGLGSGCGTAGAGGAPGVSNGMGSGNPGSPGTAGGSCTVPGADGAGGSGAGAIGADRLFGNGHGVVGLRGDDGGGGGGGGGGEASGSSAYGGGGGGGGQGGGGGNGGLPGSGGGASIGIWLVEAEATIEDSQIACGSGGAGAGGGAGSAGAAGGAGGFGAGGRYIWGLGTGGTGGDGRKGGDGSAGGRGGGGAGGPSIGIFVGPGLQPSIQRNEITTGTGGAGGERLEASVPQGHGGQGGDSYAVFDANASDGFLPVLIGNTVHPGTGGAGGGPDHVAGLAADRNF